MTRKKRTIWPGEQENNKNPFKHPQTPSSPLAHSTKEVGNKKTKEQEDQGHKMTRGKRKKGTILFGKQEEQEKNEQNDNKKKGTCFKPSSPQF